MYLPDKACKMFVACSILHNIRRREDIPLLDEEAMAPRQPYAVPQEQPDAVGEQDTDHRRGWELRDQLMAFLVEN